MQWYNKILEWEDHPVTKAMKLELQEDIENLFEALLLTEPIEYKNKSGEVTHTRPRTPEDYAQIRGMIKALRGVLDMGSADPIADPETNL